MCRSCEMCLQGKASKSHSRRRPESRVTVDTVDARERPFGACGHTDHMVMRGGSAVARTARFASIITDEKTDFKAAMPARDKGAGAILDAMQLFEGTSHDMRRWWTDGAPEFASAESQVRSLRPLAHYRSIPHRPQSNRAAERSNRMVIEGARCSIVQSGLNADWWALAIQHWCTNFNAMQKTKEGSTPWSRRFEKPAEFVVYPFGALVLFKKIAGFVRSDKWSDRLSPALLVGVSHGPGMQWDRTYFVVPLGAMLGGKGHPR